MKDADPTNKQCFFGGDPGMYRLAKRVTMTSTSTRSFSTQYDAEPYEGDLLLVHEYLSADRKVIDFYCVDRIEEVPGMVETLRDAQKAIANIQTFNLNVWHGEEVGMRYAWYAWRCPDMGLNFREWMAKRPDTQ